MDERSLAVNCGPMRRSRAQMHRDRLKRNWFFRGFRCSAGPPGLVFSDSPADNLAHEANNSAAIFRRDGTNDEPSKVAVSSGSSLLDGMVDISHPLRFPPEDIFLASAAEECKAEDISSSIDVSCADFTLASDEVPAHATGLFSEKPSHSSRDESLRTDHTSVASAASLSTIIHCDKVQLPRETALAAPFFPLDFLDVSDVSALGLACRANLYSASFASFPLRWAARHFDANMDDSYLAT